MILRANSILCVRALKSNPINLTLTQNIVAELAKKDCSAGEIKEATGVS